MLNAIRGMPLVDIKQVICGELRLNYNNIKSRYYLEASCWGTSLFSHTDCM